ncbi:MAG: NTP transferase domain-containing protein [Thermoplasmata archaeon]
MPTEPISVILTAGASTRFGGRPKALMAISGEAAVARMVRLSCEEGFAPRVVVGLHSSAIRAVLPFPWPEVVENGEWARGRTGSIQRGLEQVGSETPVLLWPVDHPFVQAKTLRRLRTVAEHDAMGVWFVPTFEGFGGHPVLLQPAVFPRIRALDPSAPLRTLLAEFGPQVVRVPVEDAGVRENVDTERDYLKFQSVHYAREDLS